MRFDCLDMISLGGDPAIANDDRSGSGDALAWVIDGSTDLGEPGLLGTRGGAAWLAMEANAAFTTAGDELIGDETIGAASIGAASIGNVCAAAFDRIVSRFHAQRTRAPIAAWELPSAAFLLAGVQDGRLEIGWMGDCSGLIRRGDAVERIGPIPKVDQESAGAAALAAHGLGGKKKWGPAILDDLRAARARPGRRALGVGADMIDRLDVAETAAAPGDELLLMTDGFAALIDSYGAYDAAGLVAAISRDGLAALAAQLRAIEAADAACARFPRYKQSDDATAMLLRIVA